MSSALAPILDNRGERALLVVAAPAEASAVLTARGVDQSASETYWRRQQIGDHLDLIVTGVGKANAAAATARLLDLERDGIVLSLGVGGALPGSDLSIGAAVVGTHSVMADEGLDSPDGFQTAAALGFPARLSAPPHHNNGMGVLADPDLLEALHAHVERDGVLATVSSGAGTAARAHAVASRTGAIVEAMEGAAVGLTAVNLATTVGARAPAFCEVRIVSNTTGDRTTQRWDLRRALDRVGALAAAL